MKECWEALITVAIIVLIGVGAMAFLFCIFTRGF